MKGNDRKKEKKKDKASGDNAKGMSDYQREKTSKAEPLFGVKPRLG